MAAAKKSVKASGKDPAKSVKAATSGSGDGSRTDDAASSATPASDAAGRKGARTASKLLDGAATPGSDDAGADGSGLVVDGVEVEWVDILDEEPDGDPDEDVDGAGDGLDDLADDLVVAAGDDDEWEWESLDVLADEESAAEPGLQADEVDGQPAVLSDGSFIDSVLERLTALDSDEPEVSQRRRRVVGDDDEEEEEDDDFADLRGRQPDEFVCSGCFLLKHQRQLSQQSPPLCTDCF